MKKCSICGEIKSDQDFFVKCQNKDGTIVLCSRCKKCHSEREMKRYYEKQAFIDSKKTPCAKCGESRIRCLSFHHVDPSNKDFTIGQLRKSSFDVIEKEIDKCICLCLNCHHEFHYLNDTRDITIDEYLKDN